MNRAALLLLLTAISCTIAFRGAQSVCVAQASGVTNTPTASPEQAFRTALGALKGRVDLLDTRGVATISAKEGAVWLIQLTNYAEIPKAGLSITVNPTGLVKLTLGDGGSPNQWLAATKGGKEDTKRKLRPEVALRKALESLSKWYTGSDALLATSGRIKLSRSKEGDEWFVDVFGYSGMRLEGFYISVKDDGNVVVKPAI
jgi:hypothetical protein